MSLSLPLLTGRPPRRALLELSPEELLSWLRAEGQPPLRARQLRRWVVAARADSFEAMTDLPLALRRRLAEDFAPLGTTVARRLTSCDGTEKLLLRLADGHLIECVLLKEADRRTVCVSTQVGCGMGCVFCASGIGGVVRNLSPADPIKERFGDDRLPHDQRHRQTQLLDLLERQDRSATRSALRDAVAALKSKDLTQVKTAYQAAVKTLSKAASKGAIPKSRAARKVSRLTLLIKRTLPQAFASK